MLNPGEPLTIDGGLGTLLESRGHDLDGELWSARLLLERPDEVRAAHTAFLEAGARVVIGASYQASYEGLERARLDRAAADAVLRRSVELALEARDAVAGDGVRRIVAASVGPYGAMLADGSEYRGDYGLRAHELAAWHRPRLEALAAAGAELLAMETVPCLAEVEALAGEADRIGLPAWIAVTATNGRLRSGESLDDAFRLAAASDAVVAVGLNCSQPAEAMPAIEAARRVTGKAIVVYPNSGEEWDPKNRVWLGEHGFPDELVTRWLDAGADLVGGCCRVGPEQIRGIARLVEARS